MDKNSEMGPLITKDHLNKVKSYVDIGVQEGAELVVDGRELKLQGYEKGYYMGGCLFDKVEKIIANSEYTKNLAISIGINPDKIIVINPGVDPVQVLNKKSLEKVESLLKVKTPRLITVSRFDKRKNHEKIIMALRNLKQLYPDIVYICIFVVL